jgi:hypothetical protein
MAGKKSRRVADAKPELSPWPFTPDESVDEDSILDHAMDDRTPPDDQEIAAENQAMLRRKSDFRTAAEYVARAFSTFEEVQRVVLFGSVALPLEKEVPRFRPYRQAGIAVWHECGDVDLAVWVTRLDNLTALRKARSRTLNQLLAEKQIGVAHHQVEVFVMEPATDRHLGRLCCFNQCPKAGKPACLVPGCGENFFLKRISSFRMRPEALQPERTVVLFARATT